MLIVGFDPGVGGAVAILSPAGDSVHDLPTIALPTAERAGRSFVPRRIDARALAVLLSRHAVPGVEMRAFAERVQALPISEGRKATVQSEGSLMRTLGAIEAVCDVLCAPAELVLPQTWQAFYGLIGKGNELRAKGELPAAVRRARELFPALAADLARVGDHNRAEALLIAHFARRKLVT